MGCHVDIRVVHFALVGLARRRPLPSQRPFLGLSPSVHRNAQCHICTQQLKSIGPVATQDIIQIHAKDNNTITLHPEKAGTLLESHKSGGSEASPSFKVSWLCNCWAGIKKQNLCQTNREAVNADSKAQTGRPLISLIKKFVL